MKVDANFIRSHKDRLDSDLDKLKSHHLEVLDYFEAQLGNTKNVKADSQRKAKILKKQGHYQQQMTQLQTQIKRLITSNKTAEFRRQVKLAYALVQNLMPSPIRHSYDQDMPFGPLDTKVRLPKTTESGLNRILAAATSGNQPDPADLLEALDVRLTPAIQQKAAELGNDPVQIYNWVYNNIAFIPSYGSIQGSEHTFNTQKGNAIDTEKGSGL